MSPCAALRSVLAWPARRLLVAAAAAVVTLLLIALPTALIPTPVFGREIPPEPWSWPVALVTAVLAGLLAGTYVRSGVGQDEPAPRGGLLGGFLSFLAVGCPVCNKLALVALGYAGALQWFAPLQPVLAVAGIGLLGWAFVRRASADGVCPVPRRGGVAPGVAQDEATVDRIR